MGSFVSTSRVWFEHRPTFDERRAFLLNILPPTFRQEVFLRMPVTQEAMAGSSLEQQDGAHKLLRAYSCTTKWS